jgi:hypothetical protein
MRLMQNQLLRLSLLGMLITASAPAQTPAGDTPPETNLPAAAGRWPAEKAWAWYRARPWLCGFNYVPAQAISYTEMFMPYSFDINRMDQELALAQSVGFNCARVVLPFVVWEHDPKAFKERFSAFLEVCAKHRIQVMPTLFDDCVFGAITDPIYGQQPEVLTGWYASGWTPSPGRAIAGDQAQWPRLRRYVEDLLASYKDDPRIFLWDLYNEPMSGEASESSVPLVAQVFDWARAVDPAQPCTVDTFGGTALRALTLERSDVITFHNYSPPALLEKEIEELKRSGRPLICSEWLNRNAGSTVQDCLPIFVAEKVGCLNWGLVNGRTQTDLNWGHLPGQPPPVHWQHDLFRGDHTPYSLDEIRLFRRFIQVETTAE